jgi:CO/xanthine dehydrogenase Mo-binding subunit/aerobic-type carbon monoxide dehydrogenase small subunit (CoxS/CutS family)
MSLLRLTVNGVVRELDVPESRYLAEVLRYDLGLTGTKIGCNEAECGICTVLVNGQPIDSCIYPAFKAQGATVETIEGLSADGALHPLQKAFLDHGATQCGICTPGLIMTAKALLDEKRALRDPVTEHDIKVALKDTYCRCTGYQSVINAILQASGRDVPPYVPAVKEPGASVGRALPNPDALSKITGRARYTDDYTFPGMLYARTRRAGVPHARLLSIDTTAAERLPGVRAVLTHRDVPGRNRHGLVTIDWPVLCDTKVRYAGDAVAIVAADTPDLAAAALDLIRVEYDPLPVVTDPIAARQPGAAVVHDERPDGNLLKHIRVRKGRVEQGFAEADVIVEKTYRTPMTEQLFLEPECSIGVPKGYHPAAFGGAVDPGADCGEQAVHGKTTIYVGSQIPYADRDQTAAALGVKPEDIRVVSALMGGGFGGKEDVAAQIHVALLAERTQRPVKMLYTRQESLLFHPKRHATLIRIKTGAKRNGRLTAVEAELYGDGGAYASLSEKVMTRATTHASGPYDVPNVYVDCYAMYTNNTPAGAFRGFGVTQSCFAVVGRITCTGQTLMESCGMKECIRIVEEEMRRHHPEEPAPFRWSWEKEGYRYAWGVALGYKNTGLGGGAPDKAAAIVEVGNDAGQTPWAEVRTSSAEMGQGLPAVLAACVSEVLGLPYERVRVRLGDTDHCPDGGPTTASRQTYLSGNAARFAAQKARAILAGAAANRLGCSPGELEFRDGQVRAPGRAVSLAEVIEWARQENGGIAVDYEYWAPKTQPLGTGGKMHFAFGFGIQAALVRVDPDTGKVDVLKVITANDVGRAINPLTLEGQIEGGIIMGLGNTLTEHYVVDNGRPWTTVMARYKMPSIKHTPKIISHFVEHPTAEGPFGAKGIGELCSIPTSPAITNAIYRATGVRALSLPVDQDALLRAMKAGRPEMDMGWGDGDPIPALHALAGAPA